MQTLALRNDSTNIFLLKVNLNTRIVNDIQRLFSADEHQMVKILHLASQLQGFPSTQRYSRRLNFKPVEARNSLETGLLSVLKPC